MVIMCRSTSLANAVLDTLISAMARLLGYRASRRDRRRSRGELAGWRERQGSTARELAARRPEAATLDAEEERLIGRLSALRKQETSHRDWMDSNPEAARRLDQLATEIKALDERLQRSRGVPERAVGLDRAALWSRPPVVSRDRGMDLGR